MRRSFDGREPMTVGVEEELMLLDPETHELAPLAAELLARLGGDQRFKLELPAAQVEIATRSCRSAGEASDELARGRRDLAAAAAGLVDLAAAGAHPFAAAEGELTRSERYDRTAAEFGAYARRQLVFALQVHVAPGSAERTLAVYNALRSYLPEIAALAANAPFHQGRDSGLASVRPKIAEALPRQGVPPPLADWDEYAAALSWGATAGAVAEPNAWWWELRPHPGFGTLEVRVPDTQTTVAEAAAVIAFVHCLIAWLGERHERGERLPVAPSWRIAENRWWAARDGVGARLADLDSGLRRPIRERLLSLLGELEPFADRLDCGRELSAVGDLIDRNGAIRQRSSTRDADARSITAWLAGRFLEGI